MLKVSIITVSYNSASTIEDTINSIRRQFHSNIEYIIVDGGSTDGTKEIIESCLQPTDRFISEKDKGIYDAMNKGILMAEGDVVGILNSDDMYYDESVISQVTAEFEKDNELSCVYGNIVYFKGNIHKIKRIWKTRTYHDQFFESGEVPPHPAVFIRRDVYAKIGLYKTDYKIAADLEFMIRLLKVHQLKSKFLNQYLVRMRIGGVSTMGVNSYLISTKEIKRAWHSNGLRYPFKLYFIRPVIKILQLLQR